MPKVKRADPEIYDHQARTQVSSVIFGLVMVVAIIVAGAALLGGSLSKAGERWSNFMDGASRSAGFSVQVIEVVGLEHLPPVAREVKTASMIAEGENMFRADPYTIRQRIEATGLVTNVRVHRMWPDTVLIRADAAQPTALWHDGETWQVVDTLGRVMRDQRPEEHASLLAALGPGAPEALPELTAGLDKMPEIRDHIAFARRIASRRWDLELESGVVIRLPADETLATGLISLAKLEATSDLTQRPLDLIDLRVANRVFLTPAVGSVTEEGAA